MKILLVGDRDILTEGLLERLGKEEHTLFLLTSESDPQDSVCSISCKTYQYDHQSNIHNMFLSVNPDAIIFSGAGYQDQVWGDRQKENLTLLSWLLEEARIQKLQSFILLSSTEVYGSELGEITEQTIPLPDSLKGTWLLQCEDMVETYRRCFGLTTCILRLGPVFGKRMDPDGGEWLSYLLRISSSDMELQDSYIQPVYTMDVADAVVRVLSSADCATYNVCTTQPVLTSRMLELLSEDSQVKANIQGLPENRHISNRAIKKDLEWVDFWQADTLLSQHKIERRRTVKAVREKKKKLWENHSGIRRFLENLVLFGVFAALYLVSSQHKLFSQIHWMLIYVMLIALCYGIRQVIISVGLASAMYLYMTAGNLFRMTNFYSYAADILTIVEFIFFGIIIAYVVETLRTDIRSAQSQKHRLQTAYDKLRDINEKNMLIKNEYEKRLLQSKNSIPNLYSIISKLSVLDADRIFVELLNVVKKMVSTDTVAIYKAVPNSNYLRLITSLNSESLMEKRSWNIGNHPQIIEAIRSNTVYQGDIWKKEPAIIMSIPYEDGGSIVLVIKKIPMEQMSLYYINTLRTLFLLASDALHKASQYEAAIREKRYIADTNVMLPEQFRHYLDLANEKERIEVADSVLLRIQGEDSLTDKYHRVEPSFREMDRFGTDGKGELYVLLSNASSGDMDAILRRLADKGILAEIITDF